MTLDLNTLVAEGGTTAALALALLLLRARVGAMKREQAREFKVFRDEMSRSLQVVAEAVKTNRERSDERHHDNVGRLETIDENVRRINGTVREHGVQIPTAKAEIDLLRARSQEHAGFLQALTGRLEEITRTLERMWRKE